MAKREQLHRSMESHGDHDPMTKLILAMGKKGADARFGEGTYQEVMDIQERHTQERIRREYIL